MNKSHCLELFGDALNYSATRLRSHQLRQQQLNWRIKWRIMRSMKKKNETVEKQNIWRNNSKEPAHMFSYRLARRQCYTAKEAYEWRKNTLIHSENSTVNALFTMLLRAYGWQYVYWKQKSIKRTNGNAEWHTKHQLAHTLWISSNANIWPRWNQIANTTSNIYTCCLVASLVIHSMNFEWKTSVVFQAVFCVHYQLVFFSSSRSNQLSARGQIDSVVDASC